MTHKLFKGDVGIGTLIVFIAMVLVAAVAASVLLNVSGVLQQKASATGKETTKQVSSNLIIVSIVGTADLSLNTIDNLTVTIRAAAGSGRIDLKNMLITIDNNEIIRRLIYNNSCSSLNNDSSSVGYCYNMTDKIDPNNVFTAGNPVIDPNSIVEIDIKNLTWNLNLSPRSTLRINLMPEIGASIFYELKTPEVYSGQVIPLYP